MTGQFISQGDRLIASTIKAQAGASRGSEDAINLPSKSTAQQEAPQNKPSANNIDFPAAVNKFRYGV